jgi:hypothetical protein
MNFHRTGKIMFKLSENEGDDRALICLDGQQRITTTTIFVASIRDSALYFLLQAEALEAQLNVPASIVSVKALRKLVKHMNGVLVTFCFLQQS